MRAPHSRPALVGHLGTLNPAARESCHRCRQPHATGAVLCPLREDLRGVIRSASRPNPTMPMASHGARRRALEHRRGALCAAAVSRNHRADAAAFPPRKLWSPCVQTRTGRRGSGASGGTGARSKSSKFCRCGDQATFRARVGRVPIYGRWRTKWARS